LVEYHKSFIPCKKGKAMTNAINKAIVYCRVSTKEQADEGYSLEAQEKLLKEYTKKNDFEIVKVYKISESASGKQLRKLFNEVFEYATKHKIQGIICEKIDRLTRNPKDAGIADDWVRAMAGREIHFVKESFVLNGHTRAHENLVWDMKVAIARFYSNNLSEEVKKGYAEKLRQGWRPSQPLIGYKTEGEKGHRIHNVNEQYAPLIRLIFERYGSGNYSLKRLAFELKEEGYRAKSGKPLSFGNLHRILHDPFYYGIIRWQDKLYQGKHEPLITKDLFDKVQVFLKRKIHNPHFQKHDYLFKTKMFCQHCGGMVTWYEKKGHVYGHCNYTKHYKNCEKKTCIREDEAEQQIKPIFDALKPKTPAVLQWIEEIIADSQKEQILARMSQAEALNNQVVQIKIRKNKLYEAKIEKSIPAEVCDEKLTECLEEEQKLNEALGKLNEGGDIFTELAKAVHAMAFYAKQIYEIGSPDQKRLLFSEVFTNFQQNAYEIRPNYTLAGDYLKNWMPKVNEDYELTKSSQTKEKTPVLPDVVSFGSGAGIRTQDPPVTPYPNISIRDGLYLCHDPPKANFRHSGI
jgi:site-specific DNA recombinase